MTEIYKILDKFIKTRRKYANRFEWPVKRRKEVGIVETLIESLLRHGPSTFKNPRASAKDPPDCIAETVSGTLVGFEVRELVCQEAIEANERGRNVYRDWTNAEVIQELQRIIKEKDSKVYFGGPYEKLILVIPTDELILTHNQLKPILDAHEFEQTKQIDEVYLLFWYDPNPEIRSYPYIKLKLAANKTIK